MAPGEKLPGVTAAAQPAAADSGPSAPEQPGPPGRTGAGPEAAADSGPGGPAESTPGSPPEEPADAAAPAAGLPVPPVSPAPDAARTVDAAGTRPAAPRPAAPRPAGPDAPPGADVLPSWPRVLATTVGLWTQRRLRRLWPAPAGPPGSARDHRRSLAVLIIAVFCVAVAAAVVVMFTGVLKAPKIARTPAARHQTPGGLASVEYARRQAADFVTSQVSRSAIVGCDPAMCLALQASGFPRGNLVPITQESDDTLQETVVVATQAVRNQFGSKLADVYTPVRLASYGSGAARIDIRAAVPSSGPNASSALQAALGQRKQYDGPVARNADLITSSAVRAQLAAGLADQRLADILVQPLHSMKVHILALGDAGPGADPVVYRALYLGAVGPHAASYFSSLESWIRSVQPGYTATYRTVRYDGQPALYVQVPAPWS